MGKTISIWAVLVTLILAGFSGTKFTDTNESDEITETPRLTSPCLVSQTKLSFVRMVCKHNTRRSCCDEATASLPASCYTKLSPRLAACVGR